MPSTTSVDHQTVGRKLGTKGSARAESKSASERTLDLRGDLRIDPPGVDSSLPAATSWLRIRRSAVLACLMSRSMS